MVLQFLRVTFTPSKPWRSCLAGSLPILLVAGAAQAEPAALQSLIKEQSFRQIPNQEFNLAGSYQINKTDLSSLTALAAADDSPSHLSSNQSANSNQSPIQPFTGKSQSEQRSTIVTPIFLSQLAAPPQIPSSRAIPPIPSVQPTPPPLGTASPLPVPSKGAIAPNGRDLSYPPPGATIPNYPIYGTAPGYPANGSATGAAIGSHVPGYPPYGAVPGYSPYAVAPAAYGNPPIYPTSYPGYLPPGSVPNPPVVPAPGYPVYGNAPGYPIGGPVAPPYGVVPGYLPYPGYPVYGGAPVYGTGYPPHGGVPGYPGYPVYGGAPNPPMGNAPGYPPYGVVPGYPVGGMPVYPVPYGTAPGPYGNPPGYQPYSSTPYQPPIGSVPGYPYGTVPAPYGTAPGPYGNPPAAQPAARTEPPITSPLGKPLNSTALSSPALQLQGVLVYQGDEFSARGRVSAAYPITPRLLFGATLDLTEGNAFSDSPEEGFNVNELYLASSFQGLPNLRFAIGQLDLTSYFDRNSFAKDGATHFFNPVFQTNPALSATGIASRPGLLANWTVTDNIEAKAAIFSSSRNLGDFALDGFAGEVGIRFGNAIIRGTYATGRDSGSNSGFQEIFQIDRGDGDTGPQRGDREEAYGINAEVFIPSIKMGIFGRYGRYTNVALDESGDTYNIGVTFLDLFAPDDRLGLAYGRALSNDNLRRDLGRENPDVLELFYDFRFLPNLRLGFTLQERNSFTETIAGVRVKTEFDVPFGRRIQ